MVDDAETEDLKTCLAKYIVCVWDVQCDLAVCSMRTIQPSTSQITLSVKKQGVKNFMVT